MTDFEDLDDVGTFEAPTPRFFCDFQLATYADTIDMQFVFRNVNPCGEVIMEPPRECLLGYVRS